MKYIILSGCLLFQIVGNAQEVMSYIDSGIHTVTRYRLLEDSIYTNKSYPDPNSKIDATASYHYDYEEVIGINRTIKEALGEDRYQMVDTETGNAKVILLTLYVDSSEIIREVEFNIGNANLEEKDIAKIAKGLKGAKFKVPPYYSKFSYIKLDVSFQLLNTKFL